MSFQLIYRLKPGESPEPKTIAGREITPERVFTVKRAGDAVFLTSKVKGLEPADQATRTKLAAARKAAEEKAGSNQ